MNMEVVASHLRTHTLQISPSKDADLFGRSSFNRYYYAAYLTVRNELIALIPEAPRAHAVIPAYLRGEVQRKIAAVKKMAHRAGDLKLMQSCTIAKQATDDLASLLQKGYKTRVVADYEPEVAVNFQNSSSDFSLDQVLSSDAQSWPHKARALMQSIALVLRSAP